MVKTENIIINNALAIIIYEAETSKWHALTGINGRKEEGLGSICLLRVIVRVIEKGASTEWKMCHNHKREISRCQCFVFQGLLQMLKASLRMDNNGNSWIAITIKWHFKYGDYYEMLHIEHIIYQQTFWKQNLEKNGEHFQWTQILGAYETSRH